MTETIDFNNLRQKYQCCQPCTDKAYAYDCKTAIRNTADDNRSKISADLLRCSDSENNPCLKQASRHKTLLNFDDDKYYGRQTTATKRKMATIVVLTVYQQH